MRINYFTFARGFGYCAPVEKKIKIVTATNQDVETILDFIRQLAVYEKLEHEMVATPELISQYLFGTEPRAEVVFVEVDSKKVGFALFFTSFSTFLSQPGIYLEDLFVLPDHRGQGFGKMLLMHLARTALERNYGRLEWSVLDWNKSAIELYLSLGSEAMKEWTVHRLSGESLRKLGHLSD